MMAGASIWAKHPAQRVLRCSAVVVVVVFVILIPPSLLCPADVASELAARFGVELVFFR
jgi:hypothetical protein